MVVIQHHDAILLWSEARAPPTAIERDSDAVFTAAWLPQPRGAWTRICVPVLALAFLGVGSFAPLWHPTYYAKQTAFWSTHLVIGIPSYLYILRQRRAWQDRAFFENIPIPPMYRRITLFFYWLFMLYWVYYSAIVLYEHRTDTWDYQIGNAVMAAAWYIFFSLSAATYYYTCVLMFQKATYIKYHIQYLSEGINKRAFCAAYDHEFMKIRRMGNVWNRIILLVLLVLFLNIPADMIAVFLKNLTWDIPSILIKVAGIFWYLNSVCKLNYMEDFLLSYLHKHHILQDEMEEITRYMSVRPLGLNFFGVRITYSMLMKAALIGINFILPTVYGLVSNEIL